MTLDIGDSVSLTAVIDDCQRIAVQCQHVFADLDYGTRAVSSECAGGPEA